MSEWKKVKIGDICKIVKGTTGIASAEPGEYPLVVTAEERKTCSTYQFDCEAVCIPLVSSSGHGKKSLKNVHYQSGKFALGTILCAVIPNNPQELDARFLHQYLQFYKDTVLVPLMKGAANVSLSMKDIATVEFPLPPIEKQRELSDLFITLQENQKKLSAETEQQLEYTKQLRQNILQDAIEGKLTADWRKSHPVIKGNPNYDAEALFEKIQKEKASDKKQKDLSPITDEEKPFEIPEGWKWVRLETVCETTDYVANGSFATIRENVKIYKTKDYALLVKTQDFTNNFKLDLTYTDKHGYDFMKKSHLFGGELLLSNIGASIGKALIVPKLDIPMAVAPNSIIIIPHEVNIIYLQKMFLSCFGKNSLNAMSSGSATPKFSKTQLRNLAIPLPSLKEQEEIVNKIESLLAKVTELENQIRERKTLSEKLAFGIIKEKLEG